MSVSHATIILQVCHMLVLVLVLVLVLSAKSDEKSECLLVIFLGQSVVPLSESLSHDFTRIAALPTPTIKTRNPETNARRAVIMTMTMTMYPVLRTKV